MIQWHRRDIIMMIVLIAFTVSRKLIALTRWRNSAPTPLTQTTCKVGAELTIQWRPNSGLSKHQSIEQAMCFWKNSQISVLHSELSAKSLNRGKHHVLRNILHLCYTLSKHVLSFYYIESTDTSLHIISHHQATTRGIRYIINSFPLYHQLFPATSSSIYRYIIKVCPATSSSIYRYIIKVCPAI